MMQDSVRLAYLEIHKAKNRAELDGCNSSERPPDFFELAAELYNNQTFEPITSRYPSLHEDFAHPIILFGKDAPYVTPQKIREKWSDVRGKLVIIDKNYEKSGIGSGNQMETDNDSGPISSFTLMDNNDHQNFLGNNKPHLLYFWQLLEEYDILDNTLAVIPPDISATSESVPETVYTTPATKRAKVSEEYLDSQRSFQSDVKTSFAEMARFSTVIAANSKLLTINTLQDKYLSLHRQYTNETDEVTKAILHNMTKDAEEMYNKAKAKAKTN
jgi:hypothetical protein